MSTYFLLYFLNYHCARQTLFEKNYKINSTTLNQNKQLATKFFLFENESQTAAQNKSALTSIEFLQDTKKFKTSLFN